MALLEMEREALGETNIEVHSMCSAAAFARSMLQQRPQFVVAAELK
jgi:hypothetical protein